MNELDTLGPRLEALGTRIAGGGDAPSADELWRSGRRRRQREYGLVVGSALAVLALVVGVVVLPGADRATVPADEPGESLDTYPARVPEPWRIPVTGAPGSSALAFVSLQHGGAVVRAVGPTGTVSTLRTVLDAPADARLSLSPDGQVLAVGATLHDLRTGRETPVDDGRSGAVEAGDAGWWSPDSARFFLPTRGGAGVVVDRDGGAPLAVPPSGAGGGVAVAGWTDDTTLLAAWETPRGFRLATYTLGDTDWRLGPEIFWYAWPTEHVLRAAASPDGRSVLLYGGFVGAPPGVRLPVVGQVFDVRTGDLVGIRVGDVPAAEVGWGPKSQLQWSGAGCRPAWVDGAPATADGRLRPLDPEAGDDVVDVSDRLQAGCLAVTGSDLRGRPVVDDLAVWSERVRSWGGLLLGLVAGATVLWLIARRRGWHEGGGALPTTPPPFLR